ncbi:uncharacterized protein DNG_00013 [Cephalotrichum gorgonifer]|uniref:Alcohol dehydrogenase n=1 Tax=Cephalotrichum gorgonifer TaxID=2041049 RepID=A0AAE8MP78_9PEZI|nr:uncharacterized protein DNG_00013 [Cephalotrichum gorgonifer]
MKAAANKPLVIQDLPIPKPQGRQVLVRVQAASLCHSDLATITGALGPLPVIIGHEAVSVIQELGPDAGKYDLHVGDTIGSGLWQDSCLECVDCKTAGPQFCKKMNLLGITTAGYFAEYALVDAATAVVVKRAGEDGPRSLPALAPVFCAGITVWDALERSELLGAKVIALDVRNEQLIAAQNDGSADEIINTRSLSPEGLARKVQEINGGLLVDKAIVTSGAPQAYQTAIGIVKPIGSIVAVGLPAAPVPLPVGAFAIGCLKLIGAKVPGQVGAKRCLDFTVRKDIRPRINSRKFVLEDINEMIDLMKAGKVDEGRMMIEFF